MKWFVVFCTAVFLGVAAAPPDLAAQPACTYFQVNASLLNISKEVGGDIYVDVLEAGDVACVTKQQQKGGRVWGFISHKLKNPDGQTPVNGWSILRYMKNLSQAEAKAAAKALPPPDAAPGKAAEKPPAPAAPEKAAEKPPASAAPPKVAAAPPAAATPPAPEKPDDSLRFDQPVPFGPFPVNGKSLKELAENVPLFPPIVGLPDELWKKNCTMCHKWNQDRLCAQGKTYVKTARHVLRHQHPYGGAYKLALMKWSKSGCN